MGLCIRSALFSAHTPITIAFGAGLATAASLQRLVVGLPSLISVPLKGEPAKALDETTSDATNNNNLIILLPFCLLPLMLLLCSINS